MTTIDELTADHDGSWLITTESGSTHVWNLDSGKVTRMPVGWSPTALFSDGSAQSLIAVLRYPKVGESAVFVIPGGSDVMGHVKIRTTTPVKSIKQLS